MGFRTIQKALIVAFVFMCILSNILEGANEVKKGSYFGLNIASSQLGGGDFDGETVVTNDYVLISFPKLNAGTAWGIVLGYRMNNLLSFEFSYMNSTHEASFFDPRENASGPMTDNISRNQLILDVKVHQKIINRIEIFGLVGWCVNFLRMDNNFFLGDSYLVGDYDLAYKYSLAGEAYFSGRGLNLGCGLHFELMRNLTISTSAIFHPLSFDGADAKFLMDAERITQDYSFDSLKGSGFEIKLSLMYTIFH